MVLLLLAQYYAILNSWARVGLDGGAGEKSGGKSDGFSTEKFRKPLPFFLKIL